MHRDLILWGKLLFAITVSLVPCAALILLSDFMLQIIQRTPWLAVIHQLICWSLCIGLSATAVGLGARFPNLRESSQARIAAGFGGTLNLVVSAVFILVSVIVAAVPSYYWVEQLRDGTRLGTERWLALGSTSGMVFGLLASLLLGALVTVIPLVIGLRAFRKMET